VTCAAIDESHIGGGNGNSHANIGQGSARLVCHATPENRGWGAGRLPALGGRLARLDRIGSETNDERKGDKPSDERGVPGS